MAERLARASACLEAGEGGSSSSSSEDGGEEEGEADEGGEVEKVVGWRFLCCFEWCGCCVRGFEEEEGEVEEVVEEADDIRGVVALSVMCMASVGCCDGRVAMLAVQRLGAERWCVRVCVLDCNPGR